MLTFFAIAAALFATATILPHLPVAHGIVRVADFPRQQLLTLAAVALGLSFYLGAPEPAWRIIQLVLLVVVIRQAWFIIRFTPVWRKQSRRYDASCDAGQDIRLVSANIKMSNRDYAAFEKMVAAADPHLVVMMEIDEAWVKGVRKTLHGFPHRVEQPQDNTYGILLASKFELADVSVQCLLTDGVPSIFATVLLPDGQRFRLYCIHPEPPVPNAGSEGRDGETALAAFKGREETIPLIVTGDLNDVAWSGTTRRFRQISRLLDPRIGRRVFNTFDARFPFLRWPLDHLFHSPHFRLVAMDRLDPGGSDHFPVMFDLVLCPDQKANSEPDQPQAQEFERAQELIGQAKRRNEPPIGSDWET